MVRILLLAFLMSVTSLGFGMGQLMPASQGEHYAVKAQDFNLETTTGGMKSFSQVRDGKKAILFFWATWCPNCHREIKVLAGQLEQLKAKGINVALVSIGETREEVTAYLKGKGIDHESFVDPDSSLQEIYQIVGVPTIFFIDEAGMIRNATHELPSDYEAFFK